MGLFDRLPLKFHGKMEHFDVQKLYVVKTKEKEAGQTVAYLYRLKVDNISLDILMNLAKMIDEGQIWMRKGSKREGRSFVGKHLADSNLSQIIIKKSKDKWGESIPKVIEKKDIQVENISAREIAELKAVADEIISVYKETHPNDNQNQEEIEISIKDEMQDKEAKSSHKSSEKSSKIKSSIPLAKTEKSSKKLLEEDEEINEKSRDKEREFRKNSLKKDQISDKKRDLHLKTEAKKSI